MNEEEMYPTINDEALKGFDVIIDGELLGTVKMEFVGPTAAEVMLAGNDVNRNVRPRRVGTYARDMARREWPWVGDPLRIDKSNKVADGQHRLLAIQKAGVTLPFLVITEMKTDAQIKMDQGASREAADALKMLYRNDAERGGSAWRRIAAIARRVWAYDQGSWADGGAVNPSSSDIVTFVKENLDLTETAAVVGDKAQRHAGFTGGVVGAAYLICARINERDANIFFDKLISGENISRGMGVYALRNKLQGDNRQGGREFASADMFRFILRAWNAERDGEVLERLITPKGGWTAKNSPVAR